MTETRTTDRGVAWYADGPPDAPALLLLHSLGASHDIWAPQIHALSRHLRIIRTDARGHGRSAAPASDWTLDDLGRDALDVLDAAGVEEAHICGVSLGGMTAMWLAAHAPARVGALVAVSTALRIGTAIGWEERIRQVRSGGVDSIADGAMGRWLSESTRKSRPELVDWCRRMLVSCSDEGYIRSCGVLRDADLHAVAGGISARTLVLVGESDPVTPPNDALEIQGCIAGAQLVRLEASHICALERADEFNAAVLEFVGSD